MTGLSLHEGVHRYLTALECAKIPEGSIRQYRSVLLRLELHLPKRQLASIKTPDLVSFLYGEGRGLCIGLAPTTASAYRSYVRTFFEYAQSLGWIRVQPVVPKMFGTARPRRPESPPTRLTEAELILLLQRAEDPMLRAQIAIGISTALRISDIQKIKCGDVNFATGELYVWVKKTGRYDPMPVTLDLDEELRRYLSWYTRSTGKTLRDADAYLFPGFEIGRGRFGMSEAGTTARHVGYQWSANRLKGLYGECGVHTEPREAWHVIRRSVARIYFDRLRTEISQDHALRETAALLGHINVHTTERYLGLQAEKEARNRNLRGKRFIGVSSRDTTVTPIRRPAGH